MATTVTLNGTTYSVPASGDEGWGDSLSNYLVELSSGRATLPPTSSTVTAGATLSPSVAHHTLSAASAVTLNTTTSISDGSVSGQMLVLQGTSDTNTITIQDGSNVELNGDIVLGDGDIIGLMFNGTVWRELYRSN